MPHKAVVPLYVSVGIIGIALVSMACAGMVPISKIHSTIRIVRFKSIHSPPLNIMSIIKTIKGYIVGHECSKKCYFVLFNNLADSAMCKMTSESIYDVILKDICRSSSNHIRQCVISGSCDK